MPSDMSHEDMELARMDDDASAAREARLEREDFMNLVKHPVGNRFLSRLLAECGVYRSTFTGEALTSAHQEGRRSVGLWLMAQLESCPKSIQVQFLTNGETKDE